MPDLREVVVHITAEKRMLKKRAASNDLVKYAFEGVNLFGENAFSPWG
jgi:hypothetical protein